MAFGQWRQARMLKKAWREAKHISNEKKDALGMQGAYFIVMGGIVISTFPEDQPKWKEVRCLKSLKKEWKEDRSEIVTATLTPAGFLGYLNDEMIHDKTFDFRAIADKSKSKYLAKGLAATQALWLIVQCVARSVVGLPLTLLEVHIAIQVVCTVVIYFFWWSKPLDVEEPIAIEIKIQREPSTRAPEGNEITTENQTKIPIPHLKDPEVVKDKEKKSKRYPKNAPYVTKKCPPDFIATVATALFDIVHYIYTREPSDGGYTEGQNCGKDITSQVQNQPIPPKEEANKEANKYALSSIFGEAILVTIIGGLHAAAWTNEFPSITERNLWRASSVGMCIFPLTAAIIVACTGYQNILIEGMRRSEIESPGFFEVLRYLLKSYNREQPMGTFLLRCWHTFLISICLLSLASYFICIQFITVESYISIRNPPAGSFMTPGWIDSWPHL